MKFSIVNGQRQEAQPSLSGKCPVCDQAMIAKCGEVNIWHWAHKGRRACDPWWENETEWHRAWKGQFPESWQEIVHQADSGEKHIADVKTDHGWVIEFQHSYLKPEERRSRDAFYPKLAWVVNGVRRKRDSEQFRNALSRAMHDGSNARMRIPFADECAILRDWAGGMRLCLSISDLGRHFGGFLEGRLPDRWMWLRSLAVTSSRYFVAARRRSRGSLRIS